MHNDRTLATLRTIVMTVIVLIGGFLAYSIFYKKGKETPPSVAEVTLAQIWAEKLGAACEPPDMNDVRWCTAYVELKNSEGAVKGHVTRMVYVSAIYSNGTVRIQWSRAEGLYRTEIDPSSVLASSQDMATLAERFRKQK